MKSKFTHFVLSFFVVPVAVLAQNVGIGTNTPTEKLHVQGGVRITSLSGLNIRLVQVDASGVLSTIVDGTAGQVLTTNGAGTLSFQTLVDNQNTLDEAYDEGGPGVGRTIDAVDGTVAINGEDGLLVTGTYGSGLQIGAAGGIPQGGGTRMFFNPNKAAFRAGIVTGTQWDLVNVGNYSTAMGRSTTASGTFSTAMGLGTFASGTNSTAMGTNTTASGSYSTAMGEITIASGTNSTAMGFNTTASGDGSTAMGYYTIASGNYSTTMGELAIASGTNSTAMGWNTTASGTNSTAMGEGATASGDGSTAMGLSTTASGIGSTAMGFATTASVTFSTAMGRNTTASGDGSTAMGASTTASGTNSTAMGASTTAPSYAETVIGVYNTTYVPGGVTSWNTGDRLFVVGNGTGPGIESDAMVILKNGNVGIGASAPSYNLEIDGGNSPLNITGGGAAFPKMRVNIEAPGDAILRLYDFNTNEDVRLATNGNSWYNGTGNFGVGTVGPSQKLEVNGNVFASSGDFYAAQTNGVINAGGGVMTAIINYIGDTYTAPSNINGDEDLYIDDDLQVGSDAFKPGGGTWIAASDRRLKTNIISYEDGLDKLMLVKPVRFNYNKRSGFRDLDKQYIGVIAQDLNEVAPYMVEEQNFWEQTKEDENGVEHIIEKGEKLFTVDPSAFTYMLINSVQEQQDMIKTQQTIIKNQNEKISELGKEIQAIKALLKKDR